MQIREISLKELDVAYELVQELREALTYDEFEDLVYEMRHQEYKMFGIFVQDELLTYAGVSVLINLYHKRHLYLFDLVTKSSSRSKGYAKSMLNYLNDYAKIQNCENIVLSSGLIREDAHRFYKREGFDKKSYLFVKKV
ncbi:MAG: GNAT family N-acetyltransferase [Campylobacterota bacterium]|nr:GNAT family N-acetyltransferase [Campylobacterota bacterium]